VSAARQASPQATRRSAQTSRAARAGPAAKWGINNREGWRRAARLVRGYSLAPRGQAVPQQRLQGRERLEPKGGVPPLADAATKGDEPSHPEAEEDKLRALALKVPLPHISPSRTRGAPASLNGLRPKAPPACSTLMRLAAQPSTPPRSLRCCRVLRELRRLLALTEQQPIPAKMD
jgi:hypothetical protein